MNRILNLAVILLLASSVVEAQDVSRGFFLKRYWFQNGTEHGNPNFNQRIRVNAPETVLHPTFGKRVEARGNGMAQILVEQDILEIDTALLYAEVWGGHPGTANKQVIINGRSIYTIPEVGTEVHHCTYHYPTIPLKVTDLVNGYNVLQFNCEKGNTFWGHYIVDNVCLMMGLKRDHSTIRGYGLHDFDAVVSAQTRSSDATVLKLESTGLDLKEIDRVYYYGFYEGYDDNGDGMTTDWHGYSKEKVPQNVIGQSVKAPFEVVWSTTMLSAQNNVRVKAEVYFKKDSTISYITPEVRHLEVPVNENYRIDRFRSSDMPKPFWSRANRKKTCTIYVDADPEGIEKAELHVLIWDGGEGEIKEHFKFNGKSFPLASGKHRHDVLYRIFEISPKLIKAGSNEIELLSDTEHHGIEILLPGPELVIKSRR